MTIDTLDNVNFARRWPVWTIHPEGGPRAAAFGHMIEVKDDEGVVVRCFTFNSHCVAPATGGYVARVGGHADSARGTTEQARGLCFVEGDIVHVAIGWVIALGTVRGTGAKGTESLTVKKSNMPAKLEGL